MPQNWPTKPTGNREQEAISQHFDEDTDQDNQETEEQFEAVGEKLTAILEEKLHVDEVRSSPVLSNSDWGEYSRYMNAEHKKRFLYFLKGRGIYGDSEGSSEKVQEFLENRLIEETDRYDSIEEFEAELTDITGSQDFKKFAPRTTSPRKPKIPDIKDIANFLSKYGEEEEILGKTHFAFALDKEKKYKRDNSEEVVLGSADNPVSEKEFIEEVMNNNLNSLYREGIIGRLTLKATGGKTWITMRKEYIEEYSDFE